MMRRGVAVMVAGTLVTALSVAATTARAAGTSPAPVASLATPLLSARRVPDWIEESDAGAKLTAALPPIFAQVGKAADTHSCLLVSQGGFTLFDDGATREVLPASNMKLITTTAVLDKLGPSVRLTTRVTASSAPVNGTLRGNLYLIGGGDPLLFTEQFDLEQDPPEPLYTSLNTLAAQVRAAGIRRIDGSVLGDESLFNTQRGVPSWKPSYEADEDVGPLSALDVNDGFRLTPPYGPSPQPAVTAAQDFTALLSADGVKVTGPAGTGDSPKGAVAVTSIKSAPLGQEIDAILRVSDDTGAELLAKLLGQRFGGAGSTAAGVGVVRATLKAAGFPVSQLHQVDGSGLSRQDRVSCGLIADVLRRAGTSGTIFPGLPIAGETGTLADRMYGTPAQGRLHAKTGTLDGVSAMSGFMLPATGTAKTNPELATPLVFSLIFNDLSDVYFGEDVEDSIGEALAAFGSAPPLADAEPLGSAGG